MRTASLLLACVLTQIASACCGRVSADIQYSAMGGSTFRFDVIVQTCLSSPFDLPEILVSINQGPAVAMPRTNITDRPSQDIRRSEYTFDHDFVTNGDHTVDAIIGGRGAGIINIPNSVGQMACIRALIVVDSSLPANNSIRFNTPPYTVTQSWNALVHAPDPSDPDGDEMVFEFGTPKGANCLEIPGYQLPSAENFLWIDPENGTFIWDYPTTFGPHNLTIIGSEHRNGQLIGQVTRDMVICVEPFLVGVDETVDRSPWVIEPTLTEDQLWILNRTNAMLVLEVLSVKGGLVSTFHASPGRSTISVGHLVPGTYLARAKTVSGEMLGITRFVRQ